MLFREDLAGVPPDVTTQARRILRKALADPNECGERGYALGWLLEAHTVGCVSDAIPNDQKLDILYAAYLQHVNDGASVVMGDPGEGAFVSARPVEDRPQKMGASDLIELGGRRKKRVKVKGRKRS